MLAMMLPAAVPLILIFRKIYRADNLEGDSLRLAFGFLTAGIGLKMGLFPLHTWLPNAYTYAPSIITVFLSATATKVAIYVLLRIYFTIFGINSFSLFPMDKILLVLVLVAPKLFAVKYLEAPLVGHLFLKHKNPTI